jgi:quercetin dioxygenase-like cupin family protein
MTALEPVLVIPGGSRLPAGPGVAVKVSGGDTSGRYMVVEVQTRPREAAQRPPGEWFYVLQGEFLFTIEGARRLAGPGASILAAAGTIDSILNCGIGMGRLLVLMDPACDPAIFPRLAL